MSGRALTAGIVVRLRGDCGTLLRVPVLRGKRSPGRQRKVASAVNAKPIPEKRKLVRQGNFCFSARSSNRAKPMAATVMTPRSRSFSPMRQGSITPLPRGSVSPRRVRIERSKTSVGAEYDARLDDHQQIYVMSPRMMDTLRNTMGKQPGRTFADPKDKIGFHGPRKPLLLSYPASPRHMGRTMFLTTYKKSASPSPPKQPTLPENREGKEAVRVAYHLRTGEFRDDLPGWKKLTRAKTIAPPPTKAQILAKEKGFVLDGVALGNIQDDYGKIQPKLGPAIPPYNSHHDPHVQNYFTYKGVRVLLAKTGQTRPRSVSIQGRYVDRFHNIGFGKEYLERRNKSGAGYSCDLIEGHDSFLRDAKPMNSYNGKFGYRRNTPTLRHCPSPFGTASRSSTF